MFISDQKAYAIYGTLSVFMGSKCSSSHRFLYPLGSYYTEYDLS